MDEPTRQFLADAAHVHLSSDEHDRMRGDLEHFMAGSLELSDLEPELQEFFRDAAAFCLTMDEADDAKRDLEEFIMQRSVRQTADERHALTFDERLAAFGDLEAIALSKEEHSAMRRALVSYMERTRASRAEPVTQERFDPREYVRDFVRIVLPRTAVLACAFLVVSTGVAFAAEGSIPGDWLYPLKVDVFERVRGRFIFTPEERAQWEATRAMRRLEEAEWLAAHQDLTDETWLQLHGNFVQHVVEAEYYIGQLADRGKRAAAADLSADLDAQLQAHRSVLQAISTTFEPSPQVETALEKVHDTQQTINRRRIEHYTEVVPEDDGERRKRAAAFGLSSAKRELARVRRGDTPPADSQAAAKIDAAQSLLNEASRRFDAGQYAEAEAIARDALKTAAEAKLLRRLPRELAWPIATSGRDGEHASVSSVPAADRDDDSSVSSIGDRESSMSISSSVSFSSVDASASSDRSTASYAAGGSSRHSRDNAPDVDIDLPGANVEVDLGGLLP